MPTHEVVCVVPPETVYLSGPMSGIQEHNFPEFNRFAKAIRALGFKVINPAESFGGRIDLPRETYLRKDFSDILGLPKDAGRVFFMPGWDGSDGCKDEFLLAKRIGLGCFEVSLSCCGRMLEFCEMEKMDVCVRFIKETPEDERDQSLLQSLHNHAIRGL